VFIDADKPGYQSYVEKILEGGLLKEGGVILAVSRLSLWNLFLV
jgi:predicted O-methyltransferase YrrM